MKKILNYNTLSFGVFFAIIILSLTIFAQAQNSEQKNLFEDFDNDGLSNSEEESFGTNPRDADTDHDGYGDGVEIASGYDPLIPAPGDRVIKEKIAKTDADIPNGMGGVEKNLTKDLTDDFVDFLEDQEESGNETLDQEDFTASINQIATKGVSFDTLPEIDVSRIHIKEVDYTDFSEEERLELENKDIVEYATAISYIFRTTFPENFFDTDTVLSEVLQSANSFMLDFSEFSYFEDLANNAEKAEELLYEISVPEIFIEEHVEALQLLVYVKSIHEENTISTFAEDPLSFAGSLGKLQGLIGLSQEFSANIMSKLKDRGLTDMISQL